MSTTRLMAASTTGLRWKPLEAHATGWMQSLVQIFHGEVQSNHVMTRSLPHPMQAIKQKLCGPNVSVIRASVAPSSSIEMSQNSNKILENSILLSSTMKKRRTKMNKHKLKKRRKLLKMNTIASRKA